MKGTAAIHTSVKQEWRERLLRNGVAAYYPLYALFRKNQSSWQLDSHTLLTYPTNSLGYALGLFLSQHQFELSNYPKVIVYFLPNSASIANTCSLMSL